MLEIGALLALFRLLIIKYRGSRTLFHTEIGVWINIMKFSQTLTPLGLIIKKLVFLQAFPVFQNAKRPLLQLVGLTRTHRTLKSHNVPLNVFTAAGIKGNQGHVC